jgi:hypothetical protein
MMCDGVIGAGGWGGVEDERAVVGSGSPRPPRRQHRGGTSVLMSSEASGQSQQSVLQVAERVVRPIVTAPMASPPTQADGSQY